ncbi:MAG: periplasmic protein TonB [Verrucomicrobiota bacterium]|jgi:TonB family protein
MDGRELNVSRMQIMRLIFVFAIAIFALVASVLAAERTTATWSDGHTSAVSDEELIRYALNSPGPGYPSQAQKTKAAGNGVYELRIDNAGVTKTVVIVKSSGSDVLDKAAAAAFRAWRFKPGIFTSVRIPVSWSVNPVRS